MSSIIEGYNYDIFISYRQKDNKHDGWVTEFVNNLKGELESTFKEEISVYFDINPHDGLLETHDVDESLKEKLKCLVFIPIISRTYCDPKSFAWEHEFKAFVEHATKDQFGLKVKLPNGNVASRVLPVRIHDLDNEDVKCYEGITGGIMRTMDFVFRTASGVNRPLKSREDHPGDNLNKTYYQDQINKVALAIKEIVQGMKTEPSQVVKVKDRSEESFKEIKKDLKIDLKPDTNAGRWKLLSVVIIVAIVVIASIFAYPKIFKRNTLEKLRSTGERLAVAVMPFKNMTNDTTWNVWQDGIQDILINNLTNSEEFVVRQIESVSNLIQSKGLANYASITPAIAKVISQKLEANIFIYGSIKQVGTTIRLNVKLIDNKSGETYKSFQIDGIADNILQITDSLSIMVRSFLIISELREQNALYFQNPVSTNSPDAYRFYLMGKKAFNKNDFPEAIRLLFQAIEIDSNYIDAQLKIPSAFGNQGLYKQAKEWCLKLYAKKDKMTLKQNINLHYIYADCFETPYESIKYLSQLKEIDDQNPNIYYNLGVENTLVNQFDKAIPEFKKALEIYKKWSVKPSWINNYTNLGFVYHETGQYKEEKKLYKQAEQDFPDDFDLIYRQAVLSLAEGNTNSANRYTEKLKTIFKSNFSTNEVAISWIMANVYSDAGLTDQAEINIRKSFASAPEDPGIMNFLAYILIDKDRNINEGLELADKALKLSPEDYDCLHTKGWGLYKQGRYQEALETLQKSWDIRRELAIYDHEAFLHLEAAKKAVAEKKNN